MRPSFKDLVLDTDKESAVADAAREAALVASIALQFGCPLETLRHALDGRDVSPLGAALALFEPAASCQACSSPVSALIAGDTQ
jgi:transposase-like protein